MYRTIMTNKKPSRNHYDFVIVGSGFGGSVSAYRLSQKGYKVLVIEKGKHYRAENFANSNWNLGKWIWMPALGLKGIMQLLPLSHVTVMSGVGVGGGSLVYGATLPTPESAFFNGGSWAGLEDWERELVPHYAVARQMLGATSNPQLTSADDVIRTLAKELGRESAFRPTTVGIYFGEGDLAADSARDPYFNGEGPARKGCIQCGRCMLGCQNNSKNSLDKNYLYLAQKLGAEILAETKVEDVVPTGDQRGSQGYFVVARSGSGLFGKRFTVSAKGVIFSAGVMGTVPLLLKLKENGSLKHLSERLGQDVRTNNETITSVTTSDRSAHYTEGVTIGSILGVDEDSHVEPIVQGPNSNGWKLLMLPRTSGDTFLQRMSGLLSSLASKPLTYLRLLFARDWGRRTFTLLFMQHLDSTIALTRNSIGLLASRVEDHQPPGTDIPMSKEVTERVEHLIDGTSFTGAPEAILGTPTTAHILGGCVMGDSSKTGVIDSHNRVFNYRNLYVCDGSAVSANPGVNPSLTITAMTEWAMSKIPSAAN